MQGNTIANAVERVSGSLKVWCVQVATKAISLWSVTNNSTRSYRLSSESLTFIELIVSLVYAKDQP